ncbi:MAG: hypothetical protein BWX49_01889 [Bacteroidetes bacterium ADurb.Bin008]|jgi:hypothetical protein|nr:MAG: hypothetical protein BWX49_01889 [Bacteroidetes bacterium ADurb.Bin008]
MGFSAAELRRGIAKLRRVFFFALRAFGALLLGDSLRYNQRISESPFMWQDPNGK